MLSLASVQHLESDAVTDLTPGIYSHVLLKRFLEANLISPFLNEQTDRKQPLRLDIKRKLTARSDRVKCVDLHPTEPWMLASLYNGNVHVWNHESQQLVKSFEVCDLPVRAAVFVPRKNWIVTGSDDMQVRVFNYNTLERAHAFEAHSDYVRCIVVHPTQPYILTSSDDMLIKLWNWEKQWLCQQVFEGHTHYVMQIVINTKDNNTLASASLDRTVKVWQLGSPTPNFTLEGHEKGVNCVDYYHGGDKPYLISGADDRMVKIWDYQNKTCVQTLEGHAQNISAVCFHPELPIVLTGSEDGTVRIWHSGTYRLESSLNYGFERVWTIACMRGSNNVALGYDEGSIMVKVGREEPAVSMDVNGEKIVWARHSEIQQANLKAMPEGIEIKDGERLPVAVKDMGSCEIYPQTIAHNPNGRKRIDSDLVDSDYKIDEGTAVARRPADDVTATLFHSTATTIRHPNAPTPHPATLTLQRHIRPQTSFPNKFAITVLLT
ncbi:Coatomer subunit beta' [Homalodisca vitripennis]|nr:Coatomer subunit beta' [Homalodisca vitripennis]